ncbi:MAG: phage tail sheath C-terminal domain-containing protein [Clostridia bacterium]|nr:phage tail sheath C-terminal domain-containing protein [Clostridia bacterium]
MALGGGNFVTQNKVLPGSYINFVSVDNGVSVFGERGTGAVGTGLNWFDGNIHTVTKEDFQKNSLAIFGYEYSNVNLGWVRDFFKNGKTLIFAGLNTDGAAKAINTYCTAKYYGSRGNSVKTVIQKNVDDENKFDVLTYMDTTLVDSQTVAAASELTSNDYVAFKGSVTLTETAGENLAGGKNGSVTGSAVQNFLTGLESCSFNAVTVCGFEDDLLLEWTKRMRDEVGMKFQCVVYDVSNKPDYEGCVCILGGEYGDFEDILPWVCGALAGCEINKSLTNKVYDGEALSQADALEYASKYSQSELEEHINNGYFTLHRVGDEVRVLMDINSLTSFTDEKGSVFSDNQTIRVCDQIAMDIATIFNTYYLGKVPNDDAGRTSFWGEIVKHHETLAGLRAIENFSSDDITVSQGDTKKSVVVTDCITVVNTMTHLYMTVIVQ